MFWVHSLYIAKISTHQRQMVRCCLMAPSGDNVCPRIFLPHGFHLAACVGRHAGQWTIQWAPREFLVHGLHTLPGDSRVEFQSQCAARVRQARGPGCGERNIRDRVLLSSCPAHDAWAKFDALPTVRCTRRCLFFFFGSAKLHAVRHYSFYPLPVQNPDTRKTAHECDAQSTSSTVGPPPPPAPGAPPKPPLGMPPGMSPPPPAAWYTFIIMGLTTPSSSFCLASNSSFSAS